MYEAQSAEQQRDDVQPFHGLSNNNDVLGYFRVQEGSALDFRGWMSNICKLLELAVRGQAIICQKYVKPGNRQEV